MERLGSHGEEDHYESSMPCSMNDDATIEQDDNSGFTIPDLKMEFEKMCSKLPLMFEVNQETDCYRCQIKSCPCGNGSFGGPNYLSSGNKAPDSLSILCKTPPLFSIPLNLRSPPFLVGSKSIGRSTKRLIQSAASGDVIVNPSQRWIFESKEANVKVRALLESSLLVHFGAALDEKPRPSMSASTESKLLKSPQLSSSPSRCKKSISRRSSELDVSERKLVSYSSENSTRLHMPTSSSSSSSRGLIHCVWKNGIPSFVLSLDNDVGDVYVANPQKVVESCADKGLGYVYMFFSKKSRKHHSNASGVVGKMKVSSSLTLSSNSSNLVETEFVLFGCHEDYLKEMETPCFIQTKSKGFSKKVTEIFSSNRNSRCKYDLKEVDDEDFTPNLELAAIVLKKCHRKRSEEVVAGGWGLKFLEKVRASNADSHVMSSFSCKDKGTDGERDCKELASRMSVIVPAGFHGGPTHRAGGPSSITERWKSGGHCDCGGWDLGCPLTVLDSDSVFSDDDTDEVYQPVSLYKEGNHNGEPTLRIENKIKDLYHINFQSSLRVLQSFAIAVAIIHGRIPELCPKL